MKNQDPHKLNPFEPLDNDEKELMKSLTKGEWHSVSNLKKTMHRSQVYLGEDQIRLLRLEARKENLSVSELIRQAIQLFLNRKTKNIDWDNDSFTKAIGTIKLDVTDVSKKIDFYLYGKK